LLATMCKICTICKIYTVSYFAYWLRSQQNILHIAAYCFASSF
jgi:hypothetical protein